MQTVLQRWFDLISINSVSGREFAAADYVEKVLRGMGLVPRRSHFPEDAEHLRPSVWTTLESGRPGRTMLLIGDLDTVDVNRAGWRTDPFTPTPSPDGERVYGRGAMDMKGGLAAILSTLEHFAAHREEFSGRILAAFVADRRAPTSSPPRASSRPTARSWPSAGTTTSPWAFAGATASK